MGILRTVNNIISLPEIYYYTLCVGVVKLQSRSVIIQTLAFLNHSYDINNSESLQFHYADMSDIVYCV